MRAADIQNLIRSGLFAYGSSMTVESFGQIDNIEPLNYTTMNQHEAIIASRKYELRLLGLYDQINEQLLAVGRKLVRREEDFIVPTIADTLEYVNAYMRQGDNKIRRGNKLYRNFTRLHPDLHQEPTEVETNRMRTLVMQDIAKNLAGPAS